MTRDLFGRPAPQRKAPAQVPQPFPDNGNHRCAVCGKSPAPFGVGSITRAPEKLKFFCSFEHRDRT